MFDGDLYNDKFIANLVKFVASDKFQTMFESYFVVHALEFSNEEEHKLRYYELYQKFHDLFEEQLEVFCDEEGMSQAEFMSRCREASVSDPKAKRYIDILLSSVEYDTFVKLMKIMRPVAAAKHASTEDEKVADSKGDHHHPSPSKASKDIDESDYRAEGKFSEYHSDAKHDKSEK